MYRENVIDERINRFIINSFILMFYCQEFIRSKCVITEIIAAKMSGELQSPHIH